MDAARKGPLRRLIRRVARSGLALPLLRTSTRTIQIRRTSPPENASGTAHAIHSSHQLGLDILPPILQNTESHIQEHSLTSPTRARAQIAAKISALGTYVPPRLLTNADLEKMVSTTDEWITTRVGIRERHIVDKGVATSDLAVEAAKKALAQRGMAASDLDAIIVGTVTPDMLFPSTACLVQHKLGAKGAWGFDLSAACSAFL